MNNNRLVVLAYIWNFSSNLVIRGLGVISTLVLVRILSSADFGIIAIAMMINGFFDVLSNVGINRYLILKKSPTDDDYSNAWCWNIVLKIVLALLMCGSASYFADYFGYPELTSVIVVMAIIQLCNAFTNVGLIKLEKELNFSIKNKILIIAKIFSFVVTIASAFYFTNYYALLIGMLVNALVRVLFSYLYCNFRVSFVLKYDQALFSTSSFLFVRNTIGYSRAQIDTFFVSSQLGKASTGDYAVSKQFSSMPYSELIGPAMAPIFSALSALKDDRNLFHKKALQTLFLILAVITPCCFGLYLIRAEFTELVLGQKWAHVSDALGLLAFLMLVFCIQPIINIIFDGYGKTKHSIWIEIFGLTTLVLGFVIVAPETLYQFIQVRVLVGFLTILFMLSLSVVLVEFNLLKFMIIITFITLPSAIMYLSLVSVDVSSYGLAIRMLAKMALGIAAYCTFFIFLIYAQFFILKSETLTSVIPSQFYKLLSITRAK
ncbi:oligosaccharide flippase family protein [Alteromonas gracilis]|uniref:oligosaccharide flippase family protein n=1 Tax=Alteromonas gracilis TaxID=1479524 RepID=UPI002FE3B79E